MNRENLGTFAIALVVVMMVGFLWCSTPARAEDVLLTFKPESVQIRQDRNGDDYVRFIMPEDKTLNGIKYSNGTTVNAYRSMVAQAKQIKPGQEIRVVASKRDYNGSTYYTILGFAPTTAKK